MSREARDERKKRARRNEGPQRTLRSVAVATGILVALAGVAYGFSLLPDPPKNVHWHPMWEVYVNGQNVQWTSGAFDMSQTRASMHLHNPNDDTIHAEGRSTSVTLGLFLAEQGGGLTDEELTIPAATGLGGTYAANETMQLRLFHQPAGEEWQEVQGRFAKHEFEDAERILLTYGDPTDEEILAQQGSVAQPRANEAQAGMMATPTAG